MQNGGFGAAFGVPIGKLMMEYYLKKGEILPEDKALEERMVNSVVTEDQIYMLPGYEIQKDGDVEDD